MPQEPIGLTLQVPHDQDPVPVYQADGGMPSFEVDAPYLLGDSHTLLAPTPVVVSAGPVWHDALGNARDAIPVQTTPGGSGLIKGPLDIIVDTTENPSIGGIFDLATPQMTLAVVTAYSGNFTTISATHGGEPLTLVRVDHVDGIATAVFYGNGMTTESATLVISAPGVTLGPAMMRMRDDWDIGALASDWNDGKAVASSIGTGWINVSSLPQPRRILYAHGSKGITGANNMNITSGMNITQGLRGTVIAGDFATWDVIAQITSGWHQAGEEFIHDIYAPSPLRVWFHPIEGDFGVKFTYTAENSFTAQLREVGDDTARSVTMAPGEHVSAYLYKTATGSNLKGVSFIAGGNVTIHSIQSIANPHGIHGNIGASTELTNTGMLQGVSSPAAAQTLTMFCIHGA